MDAFQIWMTCVMSLMVFLVVVGYIGYGLKKLRKN